MTQTLNSAYLAVRDFHVAFDHPAPTGPLMQPIARAEKRAEWIEEEAQELRDARTLEDQADAYLDIIYFGLGGLVELGLEPSKLFDIVQAANMAKLWEDGLPRRREDGKVIKPPGWLAPEPQIREEIARQANLLQDALA